MSLKLSASKLILVLLFLAPAETLAIASQPVNWETYSIPKTGTSVDIPTSVFTEKAGHPDGYGERLKTADGSAELTIQSVSNIENDTPASFLAKRHPPANIQSRESRLALSPFPATSTTRFITLAATSSAV